MWVVRVVISSTSHLLGKTFILLSFFSNLHILYFTQRTLKPPEENFYRLPSTHLPSFHHLFPHTLFLTVNINELTMLLFKANLPTFILDVMSLCIIQNIVSAALPSFLFSQVITPYWIIPPKYTHAIFIPS